MKKQARTLTLFAYDEGEGLSKHTARFDVLLGGGGPVRDHYFRVAHTVKVGDPLLLRAARPHAVKALSPMKMLLVMVRSV